MRCISVLLKCLYRILLFRVIMINRSDYSSNRKLREFTSLVIPTTHGDFIFKFLEDRRTNRRSIYDRYVKVFTVELTVPEGTNDLLKQLNYKAILVVKIMLFKVNYKLLAEVLYEICVKEYIKYIAMRVDK